MSLLGYKIYLVSFPSFDIPREFEGKFGYNGFYCQVYWYPTTPHGQPRLKKDKWLRIDQAGKPRQPSSSHPAKFTPVYDRVLKPSIGTGRLPLQQSSDLLINISTRRTNSSRPRPQWKEENRKRWILLMLTSLINDKEYYSGGAYANSKHTKSNCCEKTF